MIHTFESKIECIWKYWNINIGEEKMIRMEEGVFMMPVDVKLKDIELVLNENIRWWKLVIDSMLNVGSFYEMIDSIA